MLHVVAPAESPAANRLPAEPNGSPSLRPDALTPQEDKLLDQLRREADSEKDVFGWHAFQTLSLCSIALGGPLSLMF